MEDNPKPGLACPIGPGGLDYGGLRRAAARMANALAARWVSIVADCAAALVVTADSPANGVMPASALAPTPVATVGQLTVDVGPGGGS